MVLVVFGMLGLGVVWFFSSWISLVSLLRRQKGALMGNSLWEDRGPTPLGEKGFAPQGLTWARGKVVFANTWKNTKSRIYEINPISMTIERCFDAPAGAVHTSGLAWDGEFLWAVDYISNHAYCIDLEGSFASGSVRVLGEFKTTLRGSSACCIVPWNGRHCLAISDYMRSRRTIFVRKEEAVKSGTARGNIEFEYLNEGFSQGLEYVDGYLYEAENKMGVDIVNKIFLERLRQNRNSRQATVKQYPAPSKGVEDLAWDGEMFWTSDETVFHFFRGRLAS